MKTITFRPLRRIKKTGKITVASYMQWRKVKTADYSKFNLVIDNEYKDMPGEEYVYDHEGNLLFFYTYNPADLPIFEYPFPFNFTDMLLISGIYTIGGKGEWYSAKGVDIDGVPTFSHFSADYLGTHKYDPLDFEPLTVNTVRMWFGWFLLNLNNSYLQIGR